MEEQCRREVNELHEFFVDWFNGESEAPEFSRFERALARGFVIITPDGRLRERVEILEQVRNARGSWQQPGEPPGCIHIENFQLRWQHGNVILCSYEEWQEGRAETKGRLSTAVFGLRAETPNGVEWLHLHEVWLPKA